MGIRTHLSTPGSPSMYGFNVAKKKDEQLHIKTLETHLVPISSTIMQGMTAMTDGFGYIRASYVRAIL